MNQFTDTEHEDIKIQDGSHTVKVRRFFRTVTDEDGMFLKRMEFRGMNMGFNYHGSHGQSSFLLNCSFCNKTFECYVWSMAGTGKKCPECGANHGGLFASKNLPMTKAQKAQRKKFRDAKKKKEGRA